MQQNLVDAALLKFEQLREKTALPRAIAGTKPRKGSARERRHAAYWLDAPDMPLGPQFKSQIAWYIVQHFRGLSLRRFCDIVHDQHRKVSPDQIPRRKRGLASSASARHFEWDTYYNWFQCNGQTAPDDTQVDDCVRCILMAADEVLAGYLKPQCSLLRTLQTCKGPARKALDDCMALLTSAPTAQDFLYIPSRVHGVIPSGRPRALVSEDFERRYEDIVEALKKSRSVQVSGPHYSGKHALLRKVVAEYRDIGFGTERGSKLRLCALSLYEMSAAEAIGHLASFYRSTRDVKGAGGGTAEQISEIGHYAREFPALIVLAGLEAIDGNEIVRALHQDLIGEAVSRILDGHPETRLLVSVSASEDGHAYKARVTNTDKLTFDVVIKVADPRIPAINYRFHALGECMKALCACRPDVDQDALSQSFGDSWPQVPAGVNVHVTQERIEAIGEVITQSLLTTTERRCLGLVALSHDGLKPGTIDHIVQALRRASHSPSDWDFDPVTVLDAMPEEIVRKPYRSEGAGPNCYEVERALRDPLLSAWRDGEGDAFRLACWGIARAAAQEARRLRVASGLEMSTGRDLQVIIFLLASIRVDRIDDRRGNATLEHIVLPDLEHVDAAMPEPASILGFVYERLFRGDLVRSMDHGNRILDDARIRLAAIFPFLNNKMPWKPSEGERSRSAWKATIEGAPWSGLPRDARLKLLGFASNAAARLNLKDHLTQFARIAEAISATGGDLSGAELVLLSRIQRYEIDLAILLGRNPDAAGRFVRLGGRSGRTGFEVIEARIEKLVCDVPPALKETAEGRLVLSKLRARWAEVMHLRGRHVSACWRFLEAAEHGHGRGADDGNFVGRAPRMFVRLLVELARARMFRAEDYRPVVFDDGLHLPMLQHSGAGAGLLLRAETIAGEALRRLSAGSINDWIGTKIDHARLMAVRLKYADALCLLDTGRELIREAGASRDTVLEFLSVTGRTMVDAAAFAMAVGGMDDAQRPRYIEELERLAGYLDVPLEEDPAYFWRTAVIVSGKLCVRAREGLKVLKQLVTLQDSVITRYSIFADYLDVWIAVVQSRQTIHLDDERDVALAVYGQLEAAGETLSQVLDLMVQSGYLLLYREANLLVKGLAEAGVNVAVPDGFPAADDSGAPSR